MRIIYFYFFLLLSVNIYTQENYNSESYRVTLGDIESNTFVKDSTANALVIYEEGPYSKHFANNNLKPYIIPSRIIEFLMRSLTLFLFMKT